MNDGEYSADMLLQHLAIHWNRVEAWGEMSDSDLRLRCGELTSQEIRTVRAVLNAILANNWDAMDTNTQKQSPAGQSPALAVDAWLGFGREVFAEVTERVATESMGIEDERIMEIAEKHGLARRVEYDPARHGEVDAEPGAGIWWWGQPNVAGQTRPERSEGRCL